MTDDYREDWDIRSEEGSICFASAIYSRLVGGEQDEGALQWLAQYLRANATSHHHTAMTDQHRATPEQWDLTASEAADCSATHACILELRARVVALEAAPPHQDKLDRLIALDATDAGWVDELNNALIKAECALSDIAEGEETNSAPNTFEWAEQRCAETLAFIRPVMQQHGIRTSEWPSTAQPHPLTAPPRP